jgi:hypothetical protein
MPIVFVSYSHQDNRVARRLVRKLAAHGVKVWLDEGELAPGARLTASIRDQIQRADTLLVVASQASAESAWVGREINFAQKHGKRVIPLLIESIAEHRRFRDYVGIDATSPQTFADVVHGLLVDLFRSFDRETPAVDRDILTAGLRALAKEEPDLAPLILDCLESEGVQLGRADTVFKSAFHPLDDALDALTQLMPEERIARYAAYGFRGVGAGARALSSWIAATAGSDLPHITSGGLPLVTAVGEELEPSLIPTAIRLLTACDPPNNHALYQFIDSHYGQLNDIQRRSVIRLVTWPVRDTGNLADVLGWVAFKRFPDVMEIQQMWRRWILEGGFDGEPCYPLILAHHLASAEKEGLFWSVVKDALRSHVRTFLRSGDRTKIFVAIEHIKAAADKDAPVLAALLGEASGVTATYEWRKWAERDRDTSSWMHWYLAAICREAEGDRDWDRAWEIADKRARVPFRALPSG